MKKYLLYFLLITVIVASCKEKEEFIYPYITEPVYTWGYGMFYGPFYAGYGIPNNVQTLNLFTDSLDVDSTGSIFGNGVYLYLEDVFMTPNDTLLPEGTYKVDTTGNSFTIAKGEELSIDGQKYIVGAYAYFIEKNDLYTVRKFIIDGSMKVYNIGDKTLLDFDFMLNDSTELNGQFEQILPCLDFSNYNETSVKQLIARSKSTSRFYRISEKRKVIQRRETERWRQGDNIHSQLEW